MTASLRFYLKFLKNTAVLYEKRNNFWCEWLVIVRFLIIFIMTILLLTHSEKETDSTVSIRNILFAIWFFNWLFKKTGFANVKTLLLSLPISFSHFKSGAPTDWKIFLGKQQCYKKLGSLWHRACQSLIFFKTAIDSFGSQGYTVEHQCQLPSHIMEAEECAYHR